MDFSTVDQTYRPPCYLFSSQLLLSRVSQHSRKRKLKKVRAERLVYWQNWIELPSTTPLKTETNSYILYFQFFCSALSPPVSSAEATCCRRDAERKRTKARAGHGRSPRACLFLLVYPAGASGEERVFSMKYLWYKKACEWEVLQSLYRKIPKISPSMYKPPKPVTQKNLR